LAETEEQARSAAKRIIEPRNRPPIRALPFREKRFNRCRKQFQIGQYGIGISKCEYVYEGRADNEWAEHLYVETQGAYCVHSKGGMRVYSSTQGPTAVQRCVARVSALPMNLIEVDVSRLGRRFWQ